MPGRRLNRTATRAAAYLILIAAPIDFASENIALKVRRASLVFFASITGWIGTPFFDLTTVVNFSVCIVVPFPLFFACGQQSALADLVVTSLRYYKLNQLIARILSHIGLLFLAG